MPRHRRRSKPGATGTSAGKPQQMDSAGADSRQPKNMVPKIAAPSNIPRGPSNKARAPAPQAMPKTVHKSRPDTTTNSPSHGPQKPRRRRGDPRKNLNVQDDRLWDPSKGIKMTPRQEPDESPDGSAAPVKDKMNDDKKKNTTSPTQPNSIKKPAERTYVVAETCDPDSFDRGGVVHRKTPTPPTPIPAKSMPIPFPRNRHERRARLLERDQRNQNQRERESNLLKAKNHWGQSNISNNDVQEKFHNFIHQMEEDQNRRQRNMDMKQKAGGYDDVEADDDDHFRFQQPIPPPSHALLEYISNTEDKLLGRFVNRPGTAAGGVQRYQDLSASMPGRGSMLAVHTAKLSLEDNDDDDEEVISRVGSQIETETGLDNFLASLTKTYTLPNIDTGNSIKFAGIGAQFS